MSAELLPIFYICSILNLDGNCMCNHRPDFISSTEQFHKILFLFLILCVFTLSFLTLCIFVMVILILVVLVLSLLTLSFFLVLFLCPSWKLLLFLLL